MKKKLSLLLAFVLVLSLSVTAVFADDPMLKVDSYVETEKLAAHDAKIIVFSEDMSGTGNNRVREESASALDEAGLSNDDLPAGYKYHRATLTVRIVYDGVNAENAYVSGGLLMFTVGRGMTNEKKLLYFNYGEDTDTNNVFAVSEDVTLTAARGSTFSFQGDPVFNFAGSMTKDANAYKVRRNFAIKATTDHKTDDQGNKYIDFTVVFRYFPAKAGDKFPVTVEEWIDSANLGSIVMQRQDGSNDPIRPNVTGSTGYILVGTPTAEDPTVTVGNITGTVGTAITSVKADGTPTGGTYSVTGLPAGLSMAADGTITGTPTTAGSGSFTVTYTKDGKSATATGTYKIDPKPAVTITVSVGNIGGQVGTAIPTTTPTQTGGKTGGTWSATGLPAGLTINPSNGAITGTPTTAGSGKFTVTYTDPDGNKGSKEADYNITAGPVDPAITVGNISGAPGDPVNVSTNLTQGKSGGTYAATGLPAGVSINPSSGAITGNLPADEGNGPFTVTYTDPDGKTATANGTWTVKKPTPKVTITVNPWSVSAYAGEDITPMQASQTGAPAGGTWRLDGETGGNFTLPAGLHINPNTGRIYGNTDITGVSRFKVVYRLPDGTEYKAEKWCYITINNSGYGDIDPFDFSYRLYYETNGGNAIGFEVHRKGSVVTLTKIPVRAGYTFDGWYSDADLSNKVTEVVMDAHKVVYAGWKKTETPDVFDNEHFAYIVGYPDGTVRPGNNITRAEVATIFYRLLSDEVRNENLTTTNSFSDVNAGDWFNNAVSTMAKMGIIKGYEDGTFRPQENITRAEFAAIASRFDKENTDVKDANFTDIEGHWAKIEISKAAMKGWVTGDPSGSFRPNDKITRAEAMAITNRVLNRIVESEDDLLSNMKTWTDNADKAMWYYLDVQEATNGHKHETKENGAEKWTELLPNRDWTKLEK